MRVMIPELRERMPRWAGTLSPDELSSIKPGDHVKIWIRGESFWVTVDGFSGSVANNLALTERHGLNLGDSVAFTQGHVLEIEKGRT